MKITTIFDLFIQTPTAINTASQVKEIFGSRYEGQQTGEAFELRKAWMRPMIFLLAPAMLIWNAAFFYFLYHVLMRSFDAMDTATLFGLIFVVGLISVPFASYGFLLTYYAYCSFFNKSVWRIDHQSFSLTNTPYPFNFLGYRNFRIPLAHIASINLETDKDETYGDTGFRIVAQHKDGQSTKLFATKSEAAAHFLMEKMIQYLPRTESVPATAE